MAVRWQVAAAGLTAGLLLAGCGGSGGGGATPGPSSPPSSSSAQPTPTDRSPHGVLLSAQLVLHDARRAEFRSTLGGERAKGALFWAPKTVLQYRPDTETRQLIVLDTSAYLGGDPDTAARLGGPHWQKYVAKDIPYAGLADRLNPLVAATAAAAAAQPELVGDEKLQDSTVHHYRAVLSAARYAAAQTQLTPARRQALETALGPGDVVLDLWLNDHDQLVQLRRAAADVDTIAYTEFGASSLSVQAPAEADVQDAGTATPPPVPG
ncbi:hypothetical protein AB0K51_06315 [Kitasatospora sp. NPDC049285]|uniref:hypothetical protein n=1 Tax=Kitasatospora sp. NPDC049285 TaxID=3157096 RepID=UPI00342595BC